MDNLISYWKLSQYRGFRVKETVIDALARKVLRYDFLYRICLLFFYQCTQLIDPVLKTTHRRYKTFKINMLSHS